MLSYELLKPHYDEKWTAKSFDWWLCKYVEYETRGTSEKLLVEEAQGEGIEIKKRIER